MPLPLPLNSHASKAPTRQENAADGGTKEAAVPEWGWMCFSQSHVSHVRDPKEPTRVPERADTWMLQVWLQRSSKSNGKCKECLTQFILSPNPQNRRNQVLQEEEGGSLEPEQPCTTLQSERVAPTHPHQGPESQAQLSVEQWGTLNWISGYNSKLDWTELSMTVSAFPRCH